MSAPRSFHTDLPHAAEVLSATSPARRTAEAFLEAEYARVFGGRIRSHYPSLIAIAAQDGAIVAAAGFRLASQGPLFLEHYLDEPVEVAIEQRLGSRVRRADIAEIGNLASANPVASRTLFSALAQHLEDLGTTHAVATATRQLRQSFQRIRFPVATLAPAEAARLSEAGADWGSYYSRDPQVVVGRVLSAAPAIRAGAAAAGLLAQRSALRAARPRQSGAVQ